MLGVMTPRLSTPQRLALRAVADGALDYANPRTVQSLIRLGLVVWLGEQSAYGNGRQYRLTEKGEGAL